MENNDYEPDFHFTPQKKWMNDPNGMVGFFNLAVDGNFKTSVATKFIRINPNSSDGFEKYMERIVLSKSSNFPFGYLSYGEFPNKINNDFSFFIKSKISSLQP